MTDRAQRAVVLSGGGANGAYAAGCLRALFAGQSPATRGRPLEAEIFTGTSVGAFSAGFLVARTARGDSCLEAAEELERTWLDRIAEQPEGCNNGVFRIRADMLDYLDPRCLASDPLKPLQEMVEDSVFFAGEAFRRSAAFLTGKGPMTRRAVRILDLASALSTAPLRDLLEDSIDPEALLSPRARALHVIATNWDRGQVVVFGNRAEADAAGDAYTVQPLTEANSREAILASCSIPGIFPPVRIDLGGEDETFFFVDGGVLMNTPLSPALRAGAREVHVVCFEPRLERLDDDHLTNTLDTLSRFGHVAAANLVDQDIEEVRKVNHQASVAERIAPIVEQLRKDPAFDKRRTKRSRELRAAVERAEAFIQRLAHRRQITVHRHYPSRTLGGMTGLLNFRRRRLTELIELGADDTARHDCRRNRCVLPPA